MLTNKYKIDPWSIIDDSFNAEKVVDTESIFSLGNGKIGQRGNFEEDFSGNQTIGNYISGIYYKDKTKVGWWKKGYPKYFAKMVNCPNWNFIRIKVNDTILDLNRCNIIDFRRELNMKEGWCERKVLLKINQSNKIEITSKKFLSIKRPCIGIIKYSIKTFNNLKISILPAIYTDVKNNDANWNQAFLENEEPINRKNYSHIFSKVIDSDFNIATFCKSNYFINSTEYKAKFSSVKTNNFFGNESIFKLKKNDTLSLVKVGGYINSNDVNYNKFNKTIKNELNDALKLGFDKLIVENIKEWKKIWEKSDIIINGDDISQQAIRFNIFQLNQTLNGNDSRLNIGPKGFTGEKYGGVTYWDTEAYCIPFYLGTKKSTIARNLLNQRFEHLPKAILNAEKIGFKNGAALYPMVTANGEECHNEWEITFEEIHRNAAIVQAIKKYINSSDDEDFIITKGIKILIAIARFWEQRTSFSNTLNKYVILGVTGPNEYENNVDNNWYTNYSAKWCLQYTIDTLKDISNINYNQYEKILNDTKLNKSEILNWKKIIKNIYIPYCDKNKIFIQNDGFFNKDLKPVDTIPIKERPINQHWSWDKILRSPYIKQADVLQGFYFFSEHFNDDELLNNFNFYEKFTVHESSLSPSIHSILASRLNNMEKAYKYFIQASRLDLDDYNSEIKQGLHITSMGGSWMSIVEGFAGLKILKNKVSLNTKIPPKWNSYSFNLNVKNRIINIRVDKTSTRINLLKGKNLDIILNNKKIQLTN